MANAYQCPECKSIEIKLGYPDIQCISCDWSEPLIDYPISWDWHRTLCIEYGLPDPGPCEPPEHGLEELHERILALEEKPHPLDKPGRDLALQEKTEPRLHGGVKL